MKILILASHIYWPEHKAFSTNKTGFGMLVWDIANKLSKKKNDVYILTHALTPRITYQRVELVSHRPFHPFLALFGRDFPEMLRMLFTPGRPVKKSLHSAYYISDKAYVRRLIKKLRPDVVHIQEIDSAARNYIEVCEETGVPFVVTAHGLIQNAPLASGRDKEYEVQFLRHSEQANIPVTVISSGLKERMMDSYYGLLKADNVSVVVNGTDTRARLPQYDIRQKYDLKPDTQIIIAVGSVCTNKNQTQIVRAFSILPQEIQEKSHLLILGTVAVDYPIQHLIDSLHLHEKVTLCGFISPEELSSFYVAATLNVLASIDEGFGLSMIEGFVYGVPCVTFGDLDAVPDIYSESAMMLCQERSDKALADAIGTALSSCWDTDAIVAHSKNFSLDASVDQYMRIYQEAICLKKDNEYE